MIRWGSPGFYVLTAAVTRSRAFRGGACTLLLSPKAWPLRTSAPPFVDGRGKRVGGSSLLMGSSAPGGVRIAGDGPDRRRGPHRAPSPPAHHRLVSPCRADPTQ